MSSTKQNDNVKEKFSAFNILHIQRVKQKIINRWYTTQPATSQQVRIRNKDKREREKDNKRRKKTKIINIQA